MAGGASAAAFSWDGTWSGKFPTGEKSVIKIANGKVALWTWQGRKQKITASSVSAKQVRISEAGGGRVILKPGKNGTANYTFVFGSESFNKVLTKN